MRIVLKTFGCRLNRAEALDQEAQLLAMGHDIVSLDKGMPPDVIIVRGCSVTAKAERDCRKAIARIRAQFPSARVQLVGCLKGQKPQPMPTAPHPVPLRTARAYLKIQDGCSGKCAFCIVPSFRGAPRSVPFAQILERARAFLDAGYRELVVTGCNLALYHDSGHGLADVLAALASEAGPHRVRLSSLEPGVCDADVLAAFAAHPNICRFIHLSVQSGSDSILRRMNRPYGSETIDRICADAIQSLGPRLSLGADIITGFPGETDADFAATCALVRRHPFSNLHVFPYSERPGTSAASMAGRVPPAVRRMRAKEIGAIGWAKRQAFAASFAGKTVEACIERDRTGWTAEYLKCRLVPPSGQTSCNLHRRSLAAGRVIRVEGDALVAEAL